MTISGSELQGAVDGAKLGLAAVGLATLFGATAWATNNSERLETACASKTHIVQEAACFVLPAAKMAGQAIQLLTTSPK